MSWEAWVTLVVLVAVVGSLSLTKRAPDVLLSGGLAVLLLTGVLTPEQALAGFANDGVVTIAALFGVVAGLRETGLMHGITRLLGTPSSVRNAQLRIMAPAAAISAFINNTPLVAILMPVVDDWARRHRYPFSKLLIPLSYAITLGGVCTLIGTSNNLIINGWLIAQTHRPGLRMFELTPLGLMVTVVGIAFLLVAADRLLPDRRPAIGIQDDPRSYTVETIVDARGPLVGRTIEEAGLRSLPDLYLMEIDRAGETLPVVGPGERLEGGDRLVFVGVVGSVVSLHRIQGLIPAADQVFKMDAPRSRRLLIEAVVSDTCPLVGQTIREGRFRSRYNAVVIAVARNGQRITGRIGDIFLQPGDTLLLEAHASFASNQRDSRDFFLVSQVEGSQPPRFERAPVALALLMALVVTVAFGWLSMLKAALLTAGLLLVTRCTTATAMRRAIEWPTLIAVAASLGIGKAMQTSGLAAILAHPVVATAGDGARGTLALVYGLTMVLSGLIGGKAAAVLVLPLAYAVAGDLHVSFLPFAVGILFASSTSVATPMGHATNMMIYGPGGYRFSDFLRIGVPLSLIIAALCVWLIPYQWPF